MGTNILDASGLGDTKHPETVVGHPKTSFLDSGRRRASDIICAGSAIIRPVIGESGYRDQVRRGIERAMPASSEASLRPRLCLGPGCSALFFVCGHCDRGQRYVVKPAERELGGANGVLPTADMRARRRMQRSPLDHPNIRVLPDLFA
jgi:hypothetical protein